MLLICPGLVLSALQKVTRSKVIRVHVKDVKMARNKLCIHFEIHYNHFKSFHKENYEEDDEMILAMKDITQRGVELGIRFEDFDTVWRLEKVRKRRKMEGFELQSLRNMVKEGGTNVVTYFEN